MNECEKKIPLQKLYEIGVVVQIYRVDFVEANRQFHWLEISLVYDKSNKHAAIYDSYNLERASTFIQNVSIENVLHTYSVANVLKYNISDATEKTYALYTICRVKL